MSRRRMAWEDETVSAARATWTMRQILRHSGAYPERRDGIEAAIGRVERGEPCHRCPECDRARAARAVR